MSDSYDGLVDEADVLRTNGNQRSDARRAIVFYREALRLGGNRDVHSRQQIGVCHQLLGEYKDAIEAYLDAELEATSYERGNIERDLGESYRRLGLLDRAEVCIQASIDLLPFNEYPSEHAASLGFLGRLQLSQGRPKAALATFRDADAKLHATGNRQTELYNKLHLASAQSKAGHPIEARRTAAKALLLSTELLEYTNHFDAPRVGSSKHHQRAIALLIGGHRGEEIARDLPDRLRSIIRSRRGFT